MIEARLFALVDRIAAAEGRRRALRPHDSDDFRSHVRLRFAERGDEMLAAHDGRSSVETYLAVVVARLLLDWRRARWGRWRPSAEAVRLGPAAVAWEERTHRDGESVESAVEALRELATREELEAIRARLPNREPRTSSADVDPDSLPDVGNGAEASLKERERGVIAERVGSAVRAALRGMDARDRLLLILVFRDAMSVRGAARAVGLDHRKAGRKVERALEALRDAIRGRGVDRRDVLYLLEAPVEGWWEENSDPGRNKPGSRPSNPENRT